MTRSTPQWVERTLSDLLAVSAERFGDRPFVITDERTASYAEVDQWATRLADGLAALGVKAGERVGLLMANHLEFVPLKFAIARAGAVAIPFNYLYRRDELAYVLAQSECNLLISMTSFAGLDYLAMLDDIAPGWEQGPTAALPALRQVVLRPDTAAAHPEAALPETEHPETAHLRTAHLRTLTVEDLTRLGDAHPGGADASSVSPDSPGDILYTSGTTGSPKGVVVSHDAVQRTAFASALTRAYEDGRRILFSLPCYHMFGYVEGLLSVMFVGGAIIPRPSFSAADYFAGIERHRANDILAVPTMLVALLEHPDRSTRDLSSLRCILSGAAPAPVWVWERARDELGLTEITTGYGMTECGGAMTLSLPEDPLEIHATTVGRVKMAGVAGIGPEGLLCDYRTADPESQEVLPLGSEGELISRGPTHMVGFWHKPEETALALRDGWLHSGDLGVVDPNGYLRLTGRSKELYKSGGELIMPKEIEELVTGCPGVSQAYAVGIPDDRWGEVGCLCIVPEPGAVIDVDGVLEVCRTNLARFKVPKHVVIRDAAALPTTPTGKVQKFRLVEELAAELNPTPTPS